MVTLQKSARGRFRDVNIEELIQSKDDPLWDDEQSNLLYLLPLALDENFRGQGEDLSRDIPEERISFVGPFSIDKSPESHIGPFKHALDFLVDVGTKIFAAEDGTIREIQEQCELWGDGPEFRDYLNYLTLQHDNGEFSQYCHLEKGSVSKLGLQIGNRVKKGDIIGITGMSGWMDRPHLHFIVFRHDKNPFGFKSLKVRFENI